MRAAIEAVVVSLKLLTLYFGCVALSGCDPWVIPARRRSHLTNVSIWAFQLEQLAPLL